MHVITVCGIPVIILLPIEIILGTRSNFENAWSNMVQLQQLEEKVMFTGHLQWMDYLFFIHPDAYEKQIYMDMLWNHGASSVCLRMEILYYHEQLVRWSLTMFLWLCCVIWELDSSKLLPLHQHKQLVMGSPITCNLNALIKKLHLMYLIFCIKFN